MTFLRFFCQFLVFFKPFDFGGFNFFIYTYIFSNYTILRKCWYQNFENPLKTKVTRSIFVKALCVGGVVGSQEEAQKVSFICPNYLNCLIGKKWTYRIAIDTQRNRMLFLRFSHKLHVNMSSSFAIIKILDFKIFLNHPVYIYQKKTELFLHKRWETVVYRVKPLEF